METDESLQLTNTAGVDTVEQAMFVTCLFFDGPQDGQSTTTRTIQINISNTSVDPGPDPDPDPEPTPGDTLPIFRWALVENSAEEPPGLEVRSINSWSKYYSQKPSADSGMLLLKPAPPGWYASYNHEVWCGGSDGSCPSADFIDPICDVSIACELEFTDFTLLLNATAGETSRSATETSMEPQYKKILVAGGSSCTNTPITILTGNGSVNLEMRNPLYNENWSPNPSYDPVNDSPARFGIQNRNFSSYQIVDNVSINGVTASYLLLYPQSNVTAQASGFVGRDQMTGMLLKTFDGGSTFQYVAPRGNDVQQINVLPYTNPLAVTPEDELLKQNQLPWMLLKATSVSNGREVLVGVFYFASDSGSVVQQFYFTDDHIVWQPCTNVDRLTETVDKVWTDPETGITYATDATHTGILDSGTCSYYKSEPS